MKRRNNGDIAIYPALFNTDDVVPIAVDDKSRNGDEKFVTSPMVELSTFMNSVR